MCPSGKVEGAKKTLVGIVWKLALILVDSDVLIMHNVMK
jgi:hypothetical protein